MIITFGVGCPRKPGTHPQYFIKHNSLIINSNQNDTYLAVVGIYSFSFIPDPYTSKQIISNLTFHMLEGLYNSSYSLDPIYI